MKITRVYTGNDDRSHFGELELDFDPSRGRLPRALVQPAREVGFNSQPASHEDVMHTAPERRLVVFMSGLAEITLSDGAKRVMGPGEVILFEDVTGE